MPLDFPNTSTTGTVYTGTNNVVYIYDGVRWNGNGTGSLVPPINLTYDLGSTSSQWLNLYVGNAYVNGQPVGSVTTGTTAPTGGLGKLWYNPDVGRLYIYYDSYWVDASPPVGSSGGSGGTIDLTAVTTDVLPNTNLTYNLGSPSKQWRSLYVGTSTIYIGGTALSISTSGSLTVNGAPVSSFNTATLVAQAVSATTASFATTSGYALSFNTATLVSTAVSATNIVNGTWTLTLSTAGSILLNGTIFSGGSATTSTLVNSTATVSLGSNGYITLANGAQLYDYGSGVGNGYGITDSQGSTYIGYDPSDAAGELHMDAYNGKNIRIRTTTLPSTYKDWLFAANGTLTFPDATVQTTAFTGGGTVSNTGTTSTFIISNTSTSNSTNTGALQVVGGVGIGGGVYVGGTVTATTFTGLASAGTTATTAAALGYLGMPQNSTASSYTLVAGDQGKHIYITATGQTITVPANGTTAFPIGTTIAIIAGPSATSSSIAITTDTMYLGGTGTTGTRTLAAYGMATLVKVAATTWFINGSGLT